MKLRGAKVTLPEEGGERRLVLTFCINSTRGRGGLLLGWAKAGKDSKGRNKATRSEGDDKDRDVYDRQRRLLLSWAKAGKDSRGRNKATRSEGDDLGDSAACALMRHGGRGRGGRG